MDCDPIPTCKLASFQLGFGDFQMNADINSFREIDYINNNRQIILFSDLTQNGKTLDHAPRTLLKTAVSNLSKLGYNIEVECGINFTVFNEKFRKNQDNLEEAVAITEHSNRFNFLNQQVHDELLNGFKKSLKLSGINVESISGDVAPGQFRLNLGLTQDLIEFCDSIVITKLVIFNLN